MLHSGARRRLTKLKGVKAETRIGSNSSRTRAFSISTLSLSLSFIYTLNKRCTHVRDSLHFGNRAKDHSPRLYVLPHETFTCDTTLIRLRLSRARVLLLLACLLIWCASWDYLRVYGYTSELERERCTGAKCAAPNRQWVCGVCLRRTTERHLTASFDNRRTGSKSAVRDISSDDKWFWRRK